MHDYSLVSPERTRTYVLAKFGKAATPLIIGLAEQLRPGRFQCVLYPKPDTITAIQKKGPTWGKRLDHTYSRRNDAIWAIKTAFENAALQQPTKETPA